MQTLVGSNDPVLLSYVKTLLEEAGLPFAHWDSNASLIEGSIGILPNRLMVLDEDFERAAALLREMGLADELFDRAG